MGDLKAVDTLAYNHINSVISVGSALEKDAMSSAGAVAATGADSDVDAGADIDANAVGAAVRPEEWADLTFSAFLSDGTRAQLVPGGSEIPVTSLNWREYGKQICLNFTSSFSKHEVLNCSASCLGCFSFPLH
jgi:hypothetical protein